ncbi:ABC transporter permease [Gulosibacter molinativorax]|uniref:ABC transporter permease n=1 Tax=Gulosibacter molinativorax TaxID=256821 RepID=A0ABT7C7V5_9MICO|nr:ABC transporter permease [Gulosibacter molinativorax]MDJ1371290.1 ABC transporter permease [Gulosibacter molinativorax]QUY63648.1 Aliphatic sulfonates ABC transporter permease SsuC [Gulosibacter molinativorax]
MSIDAETTTAQDPVIAVVATEPPAEAPVAPPISKRRRRGLGWAVGAIVPLVLFVFWQWSTSAGLFTPVQLPAPRAVYDAAVDLVDRGQLFGHIGISLQRVLLGFFIGAVLGVVIGSIIGLSRLSHMLFAPTIGAFRAVTGLAWVPLLALWIGIGEDAKVTLVAIGAFFPVYTTVASALRHVDPHLIEAGKAFGLHGVSLLVSVRIPAALPAILSGLRLALAQAWLFVVAAELLASSEGLGFLLVDSQNNGRVDRMILAIILLAVIGKICDSLFAVAEKAALKKWS